MKGYQHILCGIDLSTHSKATIQKAIALSSTFKAELDILHVVEPPLFYLSGFEITENALREMKAGAEHSLKEFASTYKIPSKNCHLALGSAKTHILGTAINLKCDLLLLGSHGAGTNIVNLIGSTANAVLSSAQCDVLIVQVNPLAAIPDPNEPMPPQSYVRFSNELDWLSKQVPKETIRKQYGIPEPKPGQAETKGFGQDIHRGPRLEKRPLNAPYGPRKDQKDEEQ
ncbi:MAG: universal stress protein [Gammaproteobacteria bacterium]